jgi:hypothetical protein
LYFSKDKKSKDLPVDLRALAALKRLSNPRTDPIER